MILDTIQLINDGSPGMIAATFVVDTTAPEVVATFAAAPNTWFGVFAESNGYQQFTPKDNLNILSVSVVLPHKIKLSSPAWIGLSWRETLTDYQVAEWGTNGRQWIVDNQIEIPLNLFVQWSPLSPGLAGADLCVNSAVFPISMIGVPAILHGATLPIKVCAKVEHTLPLLP